MKIIEAISRNSIFFRLVTTFLIILIPVYFMGISIYRWGTDAVRQQTIYPLQSQSDFFIKDLEEQIQRIKLLQYDLMNDADLDRLAVVNETMTDFERNTAINRVSQRLYAIKNSSNYINDVCVYFGASGKKISVNTGVGTASAEEFQWIEIQNKNKRLDVYAHEGKVYLEAWNPPYEAENSKKWQMHIEIELSVRAISEALGQFNIFGGGGCFILNRDGGVLAQNVTDTEIAISVRELVTGFGSSISADNRVEKLGQHRYIVIKAASVNLGLSFVMYLPEANILRKVKQYNLLFIIFSVLSIVIIIIFSFSTYRFIQKPLIRLVSAFRKLENGELNYSIANTRNDEFGYLFGSFNKMTSRLNELVDQVYKQKILTQKAELKQLQSQINPHFLYNSFFILYRMTKADDIENVIRFTEQLGNYFQFITRNNVDEVPLSQEVNHARIYSEIQALRFANRIKIEIEELPGEISEVTVPRLILQPLVENAFEHGLEQKKEKGILRVAFRVENGFVTILLEDNGDKLTGLELTQLIDGIRSTENDIEPTGIINIHRRLQLRFGPDSGISASRSELGGLKIELRIKSGGDLIV